MNSEWVSEQLRVYRIDFYNFVSVSFIFSLNFSLTLILTCIEPKSLFSKFCLLEIIVRSFTSLITNFEVYNVLASKYIRAFRK